MGPASKSVGVLAEEEQPGLVRVTAYSTDPRLPSSLSDTRQGCMPTSHFRRQLASRQIQAR
jgi:hypothetical protein